MQKCSPFNWIPPLRRVPGKLRVVVWIGLGVAFFLIAPDTFGKVAWSLAGWLCIGMIVLGAYAIYKAPKGQAPSPKPRREPWNPSGISNKDWNDMTDPRGDSTNPMQF